MKKILASLTAVTLILGLVGCGSTKVEEKKDITISAAASLTESLNEIAKKYEEKTGAKISINFDSSGTLQKQIEQGAPTDLFISAAKKNMDKLEEEKLIDSDTRKDLLKNKLVLIASKEYKDKINNVSDLKKLDGKISIGQPESVPAGKYAKETMEYYKLWDDVKDNIVYGKSVKQVAKYVESGEAIAGFVYNNDAKVLKKSYVKQTFDEKAHKPVVYPMAVVKSSDNKESAKKFQEYLMTKEAQDIFIKYGFDAIAK